MANFEPIFEKVILLEGGYILHEVPGDRGGMTYAGISRNSWPSWIGWIKVDRKEFDSQLRSLVSTFYKYNFWDEIQGDKINSQIVAYHIFAFGVNAGLRTAKKIAQQALGVIDDGIFGFKTMAAINKIDNDSSEEIFKLRYTLHKIFRYKNVAYQDKRRKNDKIQSNLKFLIGWINRAEAGLRYK